MAKTKTGGNREGGGQGDNSVYGGMYNFKGIMDQFYNYEPGENDELGTIDEAVNGCEHDPVCV